MAADLKTRLAKLLELRDGSDEDALLRGLPRALTDKSSYLVAKAAAIIAERQFSDLVPDLLVAYNRLFNTEQDDEDDVFVDPLSLGKKAIAQALCDLDYRHPAPFERGLRCRQREPMYGGGVESKYPSRIDTAAGLRAICALALAASDAPGYDVMHALVDALVDPYKEVRIEAIRAFESFAGTESVLLLRLKSHLGDLEPEVLGQCFRSLLSCERVPAVAFVAERLSETNKDVVFEAAAALAGSREPEAIAEVRSFWNRQMPLETRRGILYSLAESPVPQIVDLLLLAIADSRADVATAAVESLAASRFRAASRTAAHAAVEQTRSAPLMRAYIEAFGEL